MNKIHLLKKPLVLLFLISFAAQYSFSQAEIKTERSLSVNLIKGNLLHSAKNGVGRTEAIGKLGIGLEYAFSLKTKIDLSFFGDYIGYTYLTSSSSQLGSSRRTFKTNVLCIGLMLNEGIDRLSTENIQLSTNLSIGLNIPIGFEGTIRGSFLGMGSSIEITDVYSEIFPIRIAAGVKLKFVGLSRNNSQLRPQVFINYDTTTIGVGKPRYVGNFLTGIGLVLEFNK